ncbi:exported hypothetical protein [Candidatus Terasakiella magnetica]|uniref:Outer membrane protein beta-barrel domain-containing protein n=1 Tax=Candidatus Terasakiella magnetica TaxID=1867952 RepID=A0A1C3RI44_9PROT|nr:outer membrane beta-barrel protein [Candidatus Terasakiella magnetica]SCA56957.1 exported hypothetical protein [Candidatus Terasakiella magnetica]
MLKSKLKTLVLSATILPAVMSIDAFAGDDSHFDGLYAGLFTGYGGASLDGLVDNDHLPAQPEKTEDLSTSFSKGVLYGGTLGYNTVHDNLLFGLEADLGSGRIESETAFDDSSDDYAEHDLKLYGSIRGRAGVLFNDETLLYGTLGLGMTRTKLSAYDDMDTDKDTGSRTLSKYSLILGAGAEHFVSDKVSFNAAGLYSLPSTKYKFAEDELTPDMDQGDYARVKGLFQIRVGMSYHF